MAGLEPAHPGGDLHRRRVPEPTDAVAAHALSARHPRLRLPVLQSHPHPDGPGERPPEDDGPHPEYQTEWWYSTGNLETSEGARLGCQLTFFRRGLNPQAASRAARSAWPARAEILFA
ncbi:MAG: hypothetical protein NTY23_06980, partial [Chloroflexi bacterium]|nr:hypothetical protein [Chloroflexota bacterium]